MELEEAQQVTGILTLRSFPTLFKFLQLVGAPMHHYVKSLFSTRIWPTIFTLLVLGHILYVMFSYLVYLFFLAQSSSPPTLVATDAIPSPYYLQIILIVVMAVLASWPSLTSVCSAYVEDIVCSNFIIVGLNSFGLRTSTICSSGLRPIRMRQGNSGARCACMNDSGLPFWCLR